MNTENQQKLRAADVAMVRRAAEELGEHFDTVQVFATRHLPAEIEGTMSYQYGVGNVYGRYGQVSEWLIKEDERARAEIRRKEQEDPSQD
jgi:hypothetical protein